MMRVEVDLEEAFKKHNNGEKVLVLARSAIKKDSYKEMSFDDFINKHLHGKIIFLVEAENADNKSKEPAEDDSVDFSNEQESVKESTNPNRKVREIDIGKMIALKRGKWKISDIAEELNLSVATVNKYLAKVRNGEISPLGVIDGVDEQ